MTALVIGLLATVALGTAAWIVSLRIRDASIADICWGPGFAVLAWLYCALGTATVRAVVMACALSLWGVRLAAHIGRRHARQGEDSRYRAMREARGPAFWWQSLLVVFWLQAALLWLIAMPAVVVTLGSGPEGLTATDITGAALFAIGFLIESVADRQLTRFKADAANRGRVLQDGLWRYSRHPNYFGDALVWWGLYLVACSVPYGWLTVLSPLLMTVLLRYVSGVALTERTLASRPAYAAYVARTSPFVPWRPTER